VKPTDPPSYLQPYARAVKRHGADFRALLWASKRTQALRFDAMVRLQDPSGLAMLDLGCGRGDFLDFLIARGMKPSRYIGLEGVPELASAAREKRHPHARIIRADFVHEPDRMRVGADVVYCSGAFNTIEPGSFYRTLEHAFNAARQALVFNFLSSSLLAGVSYLHWHARREVMNFAQALSPNVEKLEGYIEGDCTIAMRKEGDA
jgi:phospholipid N-methyltransferase